MSRLDLDLRLKNANDSTFSAEYGEHAFVVCWDALNDILAHTYPELSSFDYVDEVRLKIREKVPENTCRDWLALRLYAGQGTAHINPIWTYAVREIEHDNCDDEVTEGDFYGDVDRAINAWLSDVDCWVEKEDPIDLWITARAVCEI